MSKAQPWLLALGSGALAFTFACGSDDSDPATATPSQEASVNDQTPPREAAALEAWLKQGAYKDWECEPEVHASRSPSPHNFNRICTNAAISEHAQGEAAWPRGAAAVKELYPRLDAKTPSGYAVYLKTDAESADGASWYWYERIDTQVVADGLGDKGSAKTICVGCHIAAGSDPAHTPTEGGRDQVYTPVSL
jgi:hypothetical protein